MIRILVRDDFGKGREEEHLMHRFDIVRTLKKAQCHIDDGADGGRLASFFLKLEFWVIISFFLKLFYFNLILIFILAANRRSHEACTPRACYLGTVVLCFSVLVRRR